MAAFRATGATGANTLPLEMIIRGFARRKAAGKTLGETITTARRQQRGCPFFTGATAKQRKRGRQHFARRANELSREITALVDGIRYAFLYDMGSLNAHGAACLLAEMRRSANGAAYGDLAVLDLGPQGTTFFFVRRSLLEQRLRRMVEDVYKGQRGERRTNNLWPILVDVSPWLDAPRIVSIPNAAAVESANAASISADAARADGTSPGTTNLGSYTTQIICSLCSAIETIAEDLSEMTKDLLLLKAFAHDRDDTSDGRQTGRNLDASQLRLLAPLVGILLEYPVVYGFFSPLCDTASEESPSGANCAAAEPLVCHQLVISEGKKPSTMLARTGALPGSNTEQQEEEDTDAITLPWTFTVPLPLLKIPSVQSALVSFYNNVELRVQQATLKSHNECLRPPFTTTMTKNSLISPSRRQLCWVTRTEHPETVVL